MTAPAQLYWAHVNTVKTRHSHNASMRRQVDLLEDKIDDLQCQLNPWDATLTALTYVKTDLAKNLRKVEKEREADKAKIATLSTQVNNCVIAYKALYQEKLEEAQPKVTTDPAVQCEKDRQAVIKRARVFTLDSEEPEDQRPDFQPNRANSRQSRTPQESYYGQPGPVSSRVASASMYTLDRTGDSSDEEGDVEMVELSRKETDSFVNNLGRYNPEKDDLGIFLKRFKSKTVAQQFNNAEACFLSRYTLNDEDAMA
ncbi:hypothetical protein AOLI_G00147530 [Acnodon oligacanthus]